MAAPVVDWHDIRSRGIYRPPGHSCFVLYPDIMSIPTRPDRNHIVIWFNVLQLWQAGIEVHLLASGTATCTGNDRGIIPHTLFVKVCWSSLTLWMGGIDLTTQAISSNPTLRVLLPGSRPRLRLRSRTPRRIIRLRRVLRHYLAPFRYGTRDPNPSLALPAIARFLDSQVDWVIELDDLFDLIEHRSVTRHFMIVSTSECRSLVPILPRRPLPAPVATSRGGT